MDPPWKKESAVMSCLTLQVGFADSLEFSKAGRVP